jgi:hypothetical protein
MMIFMCAQEPVAFQRYLSTDHINKSQKKKSNGKTSHEVNLGKTQKNTKKEAT